jgi:glycine/D-amino acid oxidase-like deaminating enzyme
MSHPSQACTGRIEAKFVLIGLGVLGSSLLKKLLEEGERDIVVIEKEKNFGGATAHSFGMLRVFHDSSTLRRLAFESYKIARNSPEAKLAEKREFLSIRPKTPALLENIKELEKNQYPLEILNAFQIEQRYNIQIGRNELGLLETDSLTFDPTDLLQCYHNATLGEVRVVRDEVCCLMETSHSIDVLTRNKTSIRASSAIIAAGVGSIPMLSGHGSSFKPKAINYDVCGKALKMPQLLNASTHEFISQRKGNTYYRFKDEKSFGKKLGLNSQASQTAYDISSNVAQESFGRVPGSRRIYFMGAWNGNAFKLSWRLSERITECLLSKTASPPKGLMNEKSKLL